MDTLPDEGRDRGQQHGNIIRLKPSFRHDLFREDIARTIAHEATHVLVRQPTMGAAYYPAFLLSGVLHSYDSNPFEEAANVVDGSVPLGVDPGLVAKYLRARGVTNSIASFPRFLDRAFP